MPPYWKSFVDQYQLVGRGFSISEKDDLSGVGAEIEILNEQGILSEQNDAYPGIAVSAAGYVPVGNCSIGTGDPYFINVNDGEGGALYRIYHDEVTDETYDASHAIVMVLKDYRVLVEYGNA